MKPGEVVTVLFPGAKTAKIRPAVVLSTHDYHLHRPDVILGLITSSQIPQLGPPDYRIRDWQEIRKRIPFGIAGL